MTRALSILALILACACSAPNSAVVEPDAAAPDVDAPVSVERPPLDVHGLGVQGFMLRYGNDVVLTAPLFTRQSAIEGCAFGSGPTKNAFCWCARRFCGGRPMEEIGRAHV